MILFFTISRKTVLKCKLASTLLIIVHLLSSKLQTIIKPVIKPTYNAKQQNFVPKQSEFFPKRENREQGGKKKGPCPLGILLTRKSIEQVGKRGKVRVFPAWLRAVGSFKQDWSAYRGRLFPHPS